MRKTIKLSVPRYCLNLREQPPTVKNRVVIWLKANSKILSKSLNWNSMSSWNSKAQTEIQRFPSKSAEWIYNMHTRWDSTDLQKQSRRQRQSARAARQAARRLGRDVSGGGSRHQISRQSWSLQLQWSPSTSTLLTSLPYWGIGLSSWICPGSQTLGSQTPKS